MIVSEEQLLDVIQASLNAWCSEEERLNGTTDGESRFSEAVSSLVGRIEEMSFSRTSKEVTEDVNNG